MMITIRDLTKARNNWTADEIDKLRDMFWDTELRNEGTTAVYDRMARVLTRHTRNSIINKCSLLGLPAALRQAEMHVENMERNMEATPAMATMPEEAPKKFDKDFIKFLIQRGFTPTEIMEMENE